MVAAGILGSVLFGQVALLAAIVFSVALDVCLQSVLPQATVLHWLSLAIILGAGPIAVWVLVVLLKEFSLPRHHQQIPLITLAVFLTFYLALESNSWSGLLIGAVAPVSVSQLLLSFCDHYNKAILVASGVASLFLLAQMSLELGLCWLARLGSSTMPVPLNALRLPMLLFAVAFFFELMLRILEPALRP